MQPTIDATPVPASALQALEQATRPTINIVTEVPESGSSGGGGGCGIGCGAASNDVGGGGGEGMADGGHGGVQTGQTLTVGPVTATSLTATDPTALTNWLNQNGFVVPAGGQAILNSYVDAGTWFIALTAAGSGDGGFGTDGGVSVGLHYSFPMAAAGVALRLSTLGAGSTMSFTELVAASRAVAPGNAPALTLTDLASALVTDTYPEAVQAAVAQDGGAGWVIEGEYTPSAVVTAPLSAWVDSSQTSLTRLSTILTPAQLTSDVSFSGTAPAGVTNSVTVNKGLASALPRRYHLGLLGVLLLGSFFLRRNWLRQS